MTDIEQKALALVNEAQKVRGHTGSPWNSPAILNEALYRAIEQHEAFRQEVSDAVEDYCGYVPPDSPCHPITRFIIAKPDPLVEAWKAQYPDDPLPEASCANLRAAIEARGGKIVWGEG